MGRRHEKIRVVLHFLIVRAQVLGVKNILILRQREESRRERGKDPPHKMHEFDDKPDEWSHWRQTAQLMVEPYLSLPELGAKHGENLVKETTETT